MRCLCVKGRDLLSFIKAISKSSSLDEWFVLGEGRVYFFSNILEFMLKELIPTKQKTLEAREQL